MSNPNKPMSPEEGASILESLSMMDENITRGNAISRRGVLNERYGLVSSTDNGSDSAETEEGITDNIGFRKSLLGEKRDLLIENPSLLLSPICSDVVYNMGGYNLANSQLEILTWSNATCEFVIPEYIFDDNAAGDVTSITAARFLLATKQASWTKNDEESRFRLFDIRLQNPIPHEVYARPMVKMLSHEKLTNDFFSSFKIAESDEALVNDGFEPVLGVRKDDLSALVARLVVQDTLYLASDQAYALFNALAHLNYDRNKVNLPDMPEKTKRERITDALPAPSKLLGNEMASLVKGSWDDFVSDDSLLGLTTPAELYEEELFNTGLWHAQTELDISRAFLVKSEDDARYYKVNKLSYCIAAEKSVGGFLVGLEADFITDDSDDGPSRRLAYIVSATEKNATRSGYTPITKPYFASNEGNQVKDYDNKWLWTQWSGQGQLNTHEFVGNWREFKANAELFHEIITEIRHIGSPDKTDKTPFGAVSVELPNFALGGLDDYLARDEEAKFN